MKLKVHSFDFEDNVLGISIPKDMMESHRFGAGTVDIDLSNVMYNLDDSRIPDELDCKFWKSGEPCSLVGFHYCGNAPCISNRRKS